MHIGSKGKPAEYFVCITQIIEAASSIGATAIVMHLMICKQVAMKIACCLSQ